MSNMTLLEEAQILGDNQLEIFKKYGTKCAVTDFYILLGGYVANHEYTCEGNLLTDRTGCYLTKTFDGKSAVVDYDTLGSGHFYSVNRRESGGRPVLPYSSIKSRGSKLKIDFNGIKVMQYGEYPQTVITDPLSSELEHNYQRKDCANHLLTGKSYIVDGIKNDVLGEPFKVRRNDEYCYNGIKCIRFLGDSNSVGEKLSNGVEIEEGKPYWVKVEPIEWMVDEKDDIAVAKRVLFAGIQFQNDKNYKGDFEKTDIKKFIDNYFSKEIIEGLNQEYSNEQNSIEETKKIIRKQNPYDFKFDKVSEEDIIRGAVESNIAVFLHGRSSEGKSARVKQLDKDCEIIYLGTATPESLNGKSVYDASTGEMKDVPPTWFKKISKKCEEEPDKIHIVFFDELTNAMPSIQKYAFNIVLDKEVNGIWQLPKNCRVVAAGNEIEDSLAANQMAEPLFNRFAHVYINTTVESWLKWAVTPDSEYERIDYKEEEKQLKIHPSIYSYIAYKSCMKKSVLRTKYDGIKPNADPRKWEMASKVLYATKNPNMLRGLIGEDLTKDFVNFCKQEVITIEDVVSGNYNQSDLNMNLGEKFVTAVGLSRVEEKDLRVVRECVGKLGAEIQATFDSLWAHGDEKRLEKIDELQMEGNSIRR